MVSVAILLTGCTNSCQAPENMGKRLLSTCFELRQAISLTQSRSTELRPLLLGKITRHDFA